MLPKNKKRIRLVPRIPEPMGKGFLFRFVLTFDRAKGVDRCSWGLSGYTRGFVSIEKKKGKKRGTTLTSFLNPLKVKSKAGVAQR